MKWSSIVLVVGICALILAMIIPCTSAAGTAEQKEFDYEKGDYKTVKDWSKVDWTKIPPGRMHDVPANKIDFSKISGAQIGALSPAQKNAVSAAQIQEHLEKLGDLSKYGQTRQAIQGKYGVKVDSLGKGAQIQGGALSATFGKKGTLDLAGKQQWEVTVAQDGQILVTGPAELGEAGITRRDSFHIDKPVSLTLKDGRKIKDVRGISYKNGQAFVPKGATATLGDYYFPPQKNAVAIFFGPPPAKPGNYVAFLPDGLAIGTTKKGSVELKPQPGNVLFGMVKREYAKDAKGNPIKDRYRLVDDTNAALMLSVARGDSLRVTSREREGKTPLIETSQGKKGHTEITTGRGMQFIFDGKKELIVPPPPFAGSEGALSSSEMRNSVAFELVPPKKVAAEVVVGSVHDSETPRHSIITSSSNRFALVTENGKEYAGTNMGLTVSNRYDANQMKTLDDLRALSSY